jgi:hypothetical protein
VPTDPAYPTERLSYTAQDADLRLVLTRLPEFPGAASPVTPDDVIAAGTEPVTSSVSANDPAYVIYTSGSTGRPKGVVVSHRNVIALVAATRDEYALGSSDVWTLFHSSAFDVSVWEMWGCLLTGGRLVVVPYFVSREPEKFRDLLPYGLEIARSLVAARPGAHAMVIGADLYSRFLNYDDRSTSVLLGDGAGAAIVGEVPEGRGFLDVHLSSHGDAQDLIKVPAGGSRTPTTAETVAAGGHLFTMQGRAVRDFVLDNIPQILDKLVTDAGFSLNDVRCFVPHQANGVLLDHLVEACGLTDTHTRRVVERYGNLGSASVPVTLDDAVRSDVIHDGDLVLLAAFGGGMSVGATLLRWSAAA